MNSHAGQGRTILSVVGPHSGCGKTSFVVHLLRHVPGWGCLKVRPAHEPSGEDAIGHTAAGGDFYFENQQDLCRAGDDTGLYLAAGAVQVEILRHRAEGLGVGLSMALDRFPSHTPIVVESSRAAKVLNPAAVILIVRPPMREMKPSTEAILAQVTDLLINAPDREGCTIAAAERLQQQFPRLRPRFSWIVDLISEPPPNSMLERLRVLLNPD